MEGCGLTEKRLLPPCPPVPLALNTPHPFTSSKAVSFYGTIQPPQGKHSQQPLLPTSAILEGA